MELILASNSPRRKEILKKAGFEFSVIPSNEEENADINLPPDKYTESLALIKANSVFKNHLNAVVLGADTIVYYNGEILGKANSLNEAKLTLKKLSGKTHKVTTGYAVISKDKTVSGSVTTNVTFNELSNEVIDSYVDSNLWIGKAGAYGIQDGFPLVKTINGSYDNVVGLPIEDISDILKGYYEK